MRQNLVLSDLVIINVCAYTFCCEFGRMMLISSSSEFKRSGGGGGKFSIDPRGVVEFDPSFPDPVALESFSNKLYGCGFIAM